MFSRQEQQPLGYVAGSKFIGILKGLGESFGLAVKARVVRPLFPISVCTRVLALHRSPASCWCVTWQEAENDVSGWVADIWLDLAQSLVITVMWRRDWWMTGQCCASAEGANVMVYPLKPVAWRSAISRGPQLCLYPASCCCPERHRNMTQVSSSCHSQWETQRDPGAWLPVGDPERSWCLAQYSLFGLLEREWGRWEISVSVIFKINKSFFL